MGGGARLAECKQAVSLRGEMHMRDSGVGQQLLSVLPQYLLPYLLLKILERVEVLQPALRRDNRVVGAEQEAVLRVRCGLVQQNSRT
jgi:hypothetical protein